MRPYVSDFMRALTSRQRERASDLLQEVVSGRERIEDVAERLDDVDDFAPVQLDEHRPDSKISRSRFERNVNTARREIEELFEVARLIALLLNSQKDELASKIASGEKELDSMEKLVDLYTFMIDDHRHYDESYLEVFHDEDGRSQMTDVPDRSGRRFTASDLGEIRVDEGVFTISARPTWRYPLVPHIIGGNAVNSAIQEYDLRSMVKPGNEQGWHMNVRSPNRISPGAQVEIEFQLFEPQVATEILISPNADDTVEIYSLKLFESVDSDSDPYEVVQSPVKLKRKKSLHFPAQEVARFRIVLNQPTFERKVDGTSNAEVIYQDMLRDYQKKPRQIARDPVRYGRPANSSPSYQDFARDIMDERGSGNRLYRSLILDSLRQEYPEEWGELLEESDPSLEDLADYISPDPGGEDTPVPSPFDKMEDQLNRVPVRDYYQYSLGLKDVAISAETLNHKAVFVTDALPSSGDMGLVKLKADYENHYDPTGSLDSDQITSIEFSVSNVSDPKEEEDWIPILPSGQDKVEGERLFPDKDGIATLRFRADESREISVFRNGRVVNDELVDTIRDGVHVGSLEIDSGLLNQDDIFTVDYHPASDHQTIDFENRGFDLPPLAVAHDDDGPGERFESTRDRNKVRLRQRPYVDGSPDTEITVELLESGVIPKEKTGEKLSPDDDLSFIQEGRNIIFNKRVDEPFRVYYSYLENSVRVRAVLRGNAHRFVTPELRSLQLKAKSRRTMKGDPGPLSDIDVDEYMEELEPTQFPPPHHRRFL